MQKHKRITPEARPIVSWPGGKTRMLEHLMPLVQATPHEVYIEPFAGGAALLLAKPPAKSEILNDLNGDLMNLYRCARIHTKELLRLVRWMPSGRECFKQIRASIPETDLQRAARTFYLLKCSTFGQAHSWLNKPLPRGLGRKFVAFRKRMERVILECRPAEDLLKLYDSPKSLFFLDPPYVGTGHLDSYSNWTPDHLQELAQKLRSIQGRFILTIDDRPEHRALFSDYTQIPVTTKASMRPGETFGELIIHNLADLLQAPCKPPAED